MQPPAPRAASCMGSSDLRPSASSSFKKAPAPAASSAARAGAPSQRRKACRVPLENSSRPVLAMQVYRLESRITARKPFMPKRGSSTTTPPMRRMESHTL